MAKHPSITSKSKDPFIAGKETDEILFVYPFGENIRKIEAAVSDANLTELSYKEKIHDEIEDIGWGALSNLKETSNGEITIEDYKNLDSGQWLNDSLVNLWMDWISRNINCKQSNICFFSSHFHEKLKNYGPTGVKSWTVRRELNIFEKKMIFIPIHQEGHWSFCVIVNPGAIQTTADLVSVYLDNNNKDQPVSCMLFFDSLELHSKSKIKKTLVGWLNFEWKRIKNTNDMPFSEKKYCILNPVGMFIYQSYVFAVFCLVCLYIKAMILLCFVCLILPISLTVLY